MPPQKTGLKTLAALLGSRREKIVAAWRSAVEADASLTTGDSLPRTQLVDHIPALLDGFETQLREPEADVSHRGDAAAHGLHRWQQGFGLAEVSRELGHLNECVVKEIDRCGHLETALKSEELEHARNLWASVFSVAVSASTTQFFKLQQMETATYVKELEEALGYLRALEQQRAGLWQQAAHDLRGNLGVVTNVAAGLGHPNLDAPIRENFLRVLGRNMRSLHNLLDDITCLARLQGGQEPRRLALVDVAALLTEMGDSLRVVATSQDLTLELNGEPDLQVESDAVKLQRIVQNLVLNAIRYTSTGGVKVSWGMIGPKDPGRWWVEVKDTGPGITSASRGNVVEALEKATEIAREVAQGSQVGQVVHVPSEHAALAEGDGSTEPSKNTVFDQGEGIGLAIVKRLCELLDATVQVDTGNEGTRFRILLPLAYPSEPPAEDDGVKNFGRTKQ